MRRRCFGAGRSTTRQVLQDLLLEAEVVDQVDVGAEDAEGLAVDDRLGGGVPEVEGDLEVVVLADDLGLGAELGRGRRGERGQDGGKRRRNADASAWTGTLGSDFATRAWRRRGATCANM